MFICLAAVVSPLGCDHCISVVAFSQPSVKDGISHAVLEYFSICYVSVLRWLHFPKLVQNWRLQEGLQVAHLQADCKPA